MPEGVNPSYRVIYSDQVQSEQIELYTRALQKGQGQEVLSAARIIDERLQSDPRNFGDPHYSLRQAKLEVFVRGVPPLLVYDAVHRTKPLVFVRKMEALPGAGF
jgi:hypothetical protein